MPPLATPQSFLPSSRILRGSGSAILTHTSGLRNDGVWNDASVATTLSVKMETERRLHLANRTSCHLVKIGDYYGVNGLGRGGNAVREISQHCS